MRVVVRGTLRTTSKGPADGAPEGIERWPDNGEPVVVVRPVEVGVVLALAKTALAQQSEEALKEAIVGRPSRMLGFLKRVEGRFVAVDENGLNPEPVGAGDILAAPSDLRADD